MQPELAAVLVPEVAYSLEALAAPAEEWFPDQEAKTAGSDTACQYRETPARADSFAGSGRLDGVLPAGAKLVVLPESGRVAAAHWSPLGFQPVRSRVAKLAVGWRPAVWLDSSAA